MKGCSFFAPFQPVRVLTAGAKPFRIEPAEIRGYRCRAEEDGRKKSMGEKKKLTVKGIMVPDSLLSGYVEQLRKQAYSDFSSYCFQRAWETALSDEEDGLLKITKEAAFFPYPKLENGKIWMHYTVLLLRQDDKDLLHYLNAGAAYWRDGRIMTCRLSLAEITKMTLSYAEVLVTEYPGGSSGERNLARCIDVDDREMALLREAGVIR